MNAPFSARAIPPPCWSGTTVSLPFKKFTGKRRRPTASSPTRPWRWRYEARHASAGRRSRRDAATDALGTYATQCARRRAHELLRGPLYQAKRPPNFLRAPGDLQSPILVARSRRTGRRFSWFARCSWRPVVRIHVQGLSYGMSLALFHPEKLGRAFGNLVAPESELGTRPAGAGPRHGFPRMGGHRSLRRSGQAPPSLRGSP